MATSNVVVGGASVTGPQWKELVRQIVDNELSSEQVQAIIEHRNPFAVERSVSPSALGIAEAQLAAWHTLYQERGIELGEILIPERKPCFDRLIVVAARLTNNQVYAWCEQKFGCWRYQGDLNTITSERSPKRAYAIWVRERVEADEELKNLSANQLEKKKVSGITLLERLLYELKYFAETGKHLDVENFTLCAGSRCSDGNVPRVGWRSGRREVGVSWCGPDRARDGLRARAVVS